MAQDTVNLYNLALSAAGQRARVSLPDERSREAELCNMWFPQTYKQVLRAARWASASAHDALTLVAEREGDWTPGQPDPEFQFAFALPNGCLHPRYLYGFDRFRVSLLAPDRLALMTNLEQPILYFTMDQPWIEMWDAQLYFAVAYALGANIVMPISGKPSLARSLIEQANMYIAAARESAANESFDGFASLPGGRDWTVPGQRFIYPDGPMLGMNNV